MGDGRWAMSDGCLFGGAASDSMKRGSRGRVDSTGVCLRQSQTATLTMPWRMRLRVRVRLRVQGSIGM